MAKREKILLAGFSGAGKTSLLRELEFNAPHLGWEFADLDQLIIKGRGKGLKKLSDIIERDGWDKFRLYERQELEGWLKEEGKGILALGGGTLTQMLLDLYQPIRNIRICYLHASFEDCWKRLHLDHSEPRPLVKLGRDELQKIYLERQLIFSQIPWKVENVSGTDMNQLAQKVWKEVNDSDSSF